MRNSLRIATVGAALAAASFATSANAAATATATATAEVLQTLTLTADSALDFGQIAANTGGTVTVNANSTVSSTGTLISTGTRAPAGFTVTGTPDAMVGVTLPSSAATLSDGAGHSMTVDTWNSNPNGAFQLNATTGASTFEVGGTLHVASGQTPGTYSGTFDVSVEYQ
ncbi:MAG: DUF4402 domain-containing protein [Novosphingobium sp.]|uniref:DUF4402 domain-containing protein n=1 Tax=Novosphingobium sp. TaxID=1874826 RepID=UPI001DFEC5A0|nr:DUF4402 domain-containing protein [Novosphingobium sp.]MCB2057904.1 DUF4402 domain-containing protein [Novosphingobium sp.]MCP5387160.1 DUF4402 domain-containing protein [Novosphingobium sp.]